MRRPLGLLLGVILLVLVAVPSVAGAQGETVRVGIRGSGAAPGQLARQYGVRHNFGALGFTTDVPEAAVAALMARGDVAVTRVPVWNPLAEPAGRPGGSTRKLPSTQVPYGIQTMYNGALGSATKPSGGVGMKVAVIDTGIYTAHADFAGKSFFQCLDYTGAGTVPKSGCADAEGHGTHVAGTIAANGGSDGKGIYGVAPAAALGAYKVCGRRGCYVDDIAAAMDQAVADGAKIISMSLGGSSADAYTRDAAQRAAQAGVLMVVAAGNSGPGDDTIAYPSAYPETLAVASVYQAQAGTDYSAGNLVVNSWSSRGKSDSNGADGIQEREVEVAAPGYMVESTWRDGGYNTISGTSMATPHVSGLAARAWQGSAQATRDWLVAQAKKYDVTRSNQGSVGIQEGRQGYDNAAGYGSTRLD